MTLHDGTITADSDGEGRGCTFRIELPLGCPVEGNHNNLNNRQQYMEQQLLQPYVNPASSSTACAAVSAVITSRKSLADPIIRERQSSAKRALLENSQQQSQSQAQHVVTRGSSQGRESNAWTTGPTTSSPRQVGLQQSGEKLSPQQSQPQQQSRVTNSPRTIVQGPDSRKNSLQQSIDDVSLTIINEIYRTLMFSP
eukprot:gene1142-2209_t